MRTGLVRVAVQCLPDMRLHKAEAVVCGWSLTWGGGSLLGSGVQSRM